MPPKNIVRFFFTVCLARQKNLFKSFRARVPGGGHFFNNLPLCPVEKWGFFAQAAHFRSAGTWGISAPEPSFPDSGDFEACAERAARNASFRRLKITSTSTERPKRSQSLAPVLVITSGNSLVFSRKMITSTGFYRCCAPGASAPVVVKNQSPKF